MADHSYKVAKSRRNLSKGGYRITGNAKVLAWAGGGGGGYSKKNWVGVCGRLPKTLTLFMTKIYEIPYSIYDLTLKSKPCFRAAYT